MLACVRWSLERQNYMNIVTIKAESTAKEIERFILFDVVKMIEKANEFRGIPFENENQQQSQFPLTVSFSIIFPSEKEANEFVKNFKNIN